MKKILVCDDDESILDVIKIVLKNNKYDVRTESSGKKILKVVKNYSPNLILLDNSMPALDIKKLMKSIKRTEEIPVILVSAFNNLEKRAKDLEVEGFIEKPFDMEYFLRVIKNVLSRH